MAADNQSERRHRVRHAHGRGNIIAEAILNTLIFSVALLLLIFFVCAVSSGFFPRKAALPAGVWPDEEPTLQIPVREKQIRPWVLRKDEEPLRVHIANAAVKHGGKILDEPDRIRVVLTESQADALEDSLSTSKKQIRYGQKEELPYVQWAATGHLPDPGTDETLVTAVVDPLTPSLARGWVCIVLMVSAFAVPFGFFTLSIIVSNFSEARRYRRGPSPS